MYNLNHLLENIQVCFGIDSFYVYNNTSIQSNKKQHYCEVCPLNIHKKCMQSWEIGSEIARQLNGPYLYFCPLGLSFIIISRHINAICLKHDYLVAGPIVFKNKNNTFYNNHIRDIKEMSIPHEMDGKIQYDDYMLSHIAAVIFLSYNGVVFKNMEVEPLDPSQYGFQYKSMFMVENYHLRNVFAYLCKLSDSLFGKHVAVKSEIERTIEQITDIIWMEEIKDLYRSQIKFEQILCYIYNKYLESGFNSVSESQILSAVNVVKQASNFSDACSLFAEGVMLMHSEANLSSPANHMVIQSMQQYVSEHYAESLNLANIADHIHVSYAYLSSLINKELGKGFNSYLKEVRVQKSTTLLKNDDFSIAEISAKVGFADQSHYSKSFKEIYGLSPSQYRAHRTGEKTGK